LSGVLFFGEQTSLCYSFGFPIVGAKNDRLGNGGGPSGTYLRLTFPALDLNLGKLPLNRS